MVEIKIFQNGKEETSVAGDLVVFSTFRDEEDSTDGTSGIIGAGVEKVAVVQGLARTGAQIIKETSDDLLTEALLKKIFLNEFIVQFCDLWHGKKCGEEQE